MLQIANLRLAKSSLLTDPTMPHFRHTLKVCLQMGLRPFRADINATCILKEVMIEDIVTVQWFSPWLLYMDFLHPNSYIAAWHWVPLGYEGLGNCCIVAHPPGETRGIHVNSASFLFKTRGDLAEFTWFVSWANAEIHFLYLIASIGYTIGSMKSVEYWTLGVSHSSKGLYQ